MRRFELVFVIVMTAIMTLSSGVSAQNTSVPGHSGSRTDADNNGYADAGIMVVGSYTSMYAYDANGDEYLDLGDGRNQGTVSSLDELDQSTLTICDYVNNYRADYGNDPFMNSGWIINNIHCYGYDGNSTYTYLIVHESDPRYTGNPDWSVWGNWEYHVLAASGSGNQVEKVQPENHVG